MTTSRPVVDFDHHSAEFAADRERYYHLLHKTGPVWSEHYGGFWVVGRYSDVACVARDSVTFSVRHDDEPTDVAFTGIQIPASDFHLTPLETDPPRFLAYRHLLNPFFSPAAVERYGTRMHELADWCIDQVIARGAVDFVEHLATPMPAIDAMELVGLPTGEWARFADPAHAMVATSPGTPEHDAWVAEARWIFELISTAIGDRRGHPGDDFISALVHGEVDGEPIPERELTELISLVLFGGVETTTGLIAFALDYLDEARGDRARILHDRSLIPGALEEFLRFFAPNQTEARTATRDVEVGEQLIRADERVLMCWGAANRDPAVFDRPDDIVIDRPVNRHSSFGLGPHRCIGSHFARVQSSIALEHVLDRLPDYELERDRVVPYACIGTQNGYVMMPATFTPGPSVGACRELAGR